MTCSLDFCDKPSSTEKHGYCVGHHAQIFRYKIKPRPLRSRVKNLGRKCSGPDCERSSSKDGLCDAHYNQRYVGGELKPLWGDSKPCAVEGCDGRAKKNLSCGKCTARMKLYNLSLEEFNKLEKNCEVCGATSKLTIDHAHDTGAVRGRLCNSCNLTIGNAGDNLESLMRFVRYLEKHESKK